MPTTALGSERKPIVGDEIEAKKVEIKDKLRNQLANSMFGGLLKNAAPAKDTTSSITPTEHETRYHQQKS